MTTDLTMQQSTELTLAKQEAQILRLQLQNLQAQKVSRLEDSLFSPALFEHYEKVAQKLSRSGMIPKSYQGKPEDIFVAMAMGYQLGFPVEQSLQDIAVINGRPCLWGDGLLSLALNHPDCDAIDEEPIYNGQVVTGYVCTVKRKGHASHSKTFTIQDAQKANLLGKAGPWTNYLERMLQLRARAFAIRDKFSDALRGLKCAEVEQDNETIIEGEIILDKDKTHVEKLKKLLQPNIPTDIKEPYSAPLKVHKTGSDDKLADEEQIKQIIGLMEVKEFSDERIKKALDYYKVETLSELTEAQAVLFLLKLEKS